MTKQRRWTRLSKLWFNAHIGFNDLMGVEEEVLENFENLLLQDLNQTVQELADTYDKYLELICSDEQVEQGKQFRAKIEELKEALNLSAHKSNQED